MHCLFSNHIGLSFCVIFFEYELRWMFAWQSVLKCYKWFCWIPTWNRKKHCFCYGQTFFWSQISINWTSHQSISEDLWTHHPHLACLFLRKMKVHEKNVWWVFFLDNLAVFPIYPHICQRACFDIKEAAVSLEGFIVMADDCELIDFQDLIKDWLLTFWHFPDYLRSIKAMQLVHLKVWVLVK